MVLGDSNLRLDLPHGVQEHTVAKAVVHEDYDQGDSVHHNDIGKAHGSTEVLEITMINSSICQDLCC